MSSSFFTELNGVEVEVIINRDYGYEPDTNAHDVDWEVKGMDGKPVEITDEQETKLWAEVYNYVDGY